MRIVVLSDTHTLHEEICVPDGDVLIHCGDFSSSGARREVESFRDWLSGLPHRHKLYVPGNHEMSFERNLSGALSWMNGVARPLLDSPLVIDGVTFYGSPWTVASGGGWAFELMSEDELAARWELIPKDVEVLITHSPPYEILDFVPRQGSWFGGTPDPEPVGSHSLRDWVEENSPPLHLFGHIHQAYGVVEMDGSIFANAAMMDARYRATRRPIVLDRVGHRRWEVVDYGPAK